MTAPDRRCGTCVWWIAGVSTGWCGWCESNLPASLPRPVPMMREHDGTDCSQWSDGADAGEGGDE